MTVQVDAGSASQQFSPLALADSAFVQRRPEKFCCDCVRQQYATRPCDGVLLYMAPVHAPPNHATVLLFHIDLVCLCSPDVI